MAISAATISKTEKPSKASIVRYETRSNTIAEDIFYKGARRRLSLPSRIAPYRKTLQVDIATRRLL